MVRKKFISMMLCLSLVFQTGAMAYGDEILYSEDTEIAGQSLLEETSEEYSSQEEEASSQDENVQDQGAEAQSDEGDWGDDLIIDDGVLEDDSPETVSTESSGETEGQNTTTASSGETEVDSEMEISGGYESVSESDQQNGSAPEESESEEELFEEESESEGLIEVSEEELQMITFTETIELADATVVSADSVSVYSRFRSVVQYDGCFGNQLSGSALELYNERVNYYVTGRNTGVMELNYTSQSCPYTFAAELIWNEDGTIAGINKETEEYLAFKQQVLFDMQSSLDAFLYDHPEIFWFRGGSASYAVGLVNTSNGYKGYVTWLKYTPEVAFDGAKDLVSAYDAAVPQTIAQIKAESDINGNGRVEQMELIKTIHDYLCERFYYDTDAYANYETTKDYRIFCSAGAFLDSVGTGVVCEGYAKSFKVICDQLGIPCVLIGGTVTQNGKTEGHMWNGVQLNGKWYLMDVTWDEDSIAGVKYTYFMAGDITSGRTSSGSFGGAAIGTIFVYPQLESEGLVYCQDFNHEAYVTEVVAPTCTTQGYTTHTCSRCGDSYKDTYAKELGHNYQPTVTAATCKAKGYTTYKCSRCLSSYQADETDIASHSYSNGICIWCGISDTIVNATVSKLYSYGYDPKGVKPEVTVKFGTNVLKLGTDYTVTYRNNTALGTGYATVTGIGKYRGTVSRSFKIIKRVVKKLTFPTLADRVYTGKSQKPTVTIYNNGTKLKKNTDYTITYFKNKNVGQAVITIKLKGNYTGTKKLYFNILPKTPILSKVKSASKGKMTVYWKKASGAGGYQIQYSLNSNFSSAKTATATGTSKTISKLKKGKVYYVRVRSYKKVSGKKYYSSWSKAKKVTIKK